MAFPISMPDPTQSPSSLQFGKGSNAQKAGTPDAGPRSYGQAVASHRSLSSRPDRAESGAYTQFLRKGKAACRAPLAGRLASRKRPCGLSFRSERENRVTCQGRRFSYGGPV
jgi:hypothetical protein